MEQVSWIFSHSCRFPPVFMEKSKMGIGISLLGLIIIFHNNYNIFIFVLPQRRKAKQKKTEKWILKVVWWRRKWNLARASHHREGYWRTQLCCVRSRTTAVAAAVLAAARVPMRNQWLIKLWRIKVCSGNPCLVLWRRNQYGDSRPFHCWLLGTRSPGRIWGGSWLELEAPSTKSVTVKDFLTLLCQSRHGGILTMQSLHLLLAISILVRKNRVHCSAYRFTLSSWNIIFWFSSINNIISSYSVFFF